MTRDSVHGDVQFLTGSPARFAVLSALAESPARPCELCDRIDATRTTIQRILAGYSDRQWVRKVDGDYRLTLTGRRVYERYESLLAETERAKQFGPLAEHLGPIGDELPDVVLDTGTITVGSEQTPLAPVNRLTEWFAAAEGDVKTVSPIVAAIFNNTATTLLEQGTRIESIIDHSVLERSEREFDDALARGVDDESIEFYVYETSLDFGLVVDDRGCCLGAYDDSNNLRVTLVVEDPAAREWALDRFHRYREDATPLETVLSAPE
ncbi:helix-turn-helix transcriptional regulator [Haloarcula pelagica]|uniref:helix-turn-helix transcriptional regulator n=1 Tax=Haloarcula pelagica TaxID=3033389 RepID=UPI0024C42D32|nr:transcriptional regulator FilR1 domain-containing protein [Halomicroarcula sp. YJ-61-S]